MSESSSIDRRGPDDHPHYQDTGRVDQFSGHPIVDAWGPVYGAREREYLGRGKLLGYIQRERYYDTSGPGADVAMFEIRGELREARTADDVRLPIVGTLDVERTTEHGYVVYENDGRFLPDYPRCPDCDGRIEWAEAGGVPGSRRCGGSSPVDMHAAGSAASPPGVASDPDGCGSRFVDTRYGMAADVE